MLGFLFQSDTATSILGWFAFLFIISIAFYIYFSLTLMLIARKSNTPGAGLAWIPIVNLILMCQIARRPAWWILLLFVPFVNLVVYALIWMSIAEVRGHSPLTGALAIVPFVGLIVPAILAIGEPKNPDAAGGTRICGNCRAQIFGGESFCRNCGSAVPIA
ncbi:MAG: hypothetical protein ICV86_18810, partial [Microcoleus sp. T3-bin5]|nr:hypothetical protein [Microcoleus sp. T3-bin5]